MPHPWVLLHFQKERILVYNHNTTMKTRNLADISTGIYSLRPYSVFTNCPNMFYKNLVQTPMLSYVAESLISLALEQFLGLSLTFATLDFCRLQASYFVKYP